MMQRPQRGDPFWTRVLHWWDNGAWALIALLAVLTVLGEGADTLTATGRYGSLTLMSVLGLCYAVLRRFPGNPVVRPHRYLGVLVLCLGGLAYLRDGFGVLYTVLLPQFTTMAKSPRSSIISSGLGAVAITVGGVSREGWTLDVVATNTISSLAVFAVSVLIAVLTPRTLELQAERAQLRADLEATQVSLAEAQKRQGAAEERVRLAREIHDTLAQGFASIIVLAEAARAGLGSASDTEAGAQQLRSIEQTARENLAEARVLVGSAPQGGLAPGSVARTLRRTLDRFAEDTGLAVTADLPVVECDQPTRIALLRCTQESLANVRKHAAASTVGVVLAQHPGRVELEVTDDGRGFVVAASRGFGLDGMRRRLAELGGELTVTSSVGDGTRILAVIPTNGQV